MLAIDVSNHNNWNLDIAKQFKDQGLEHVIVRGALDIEHPGLIDISHRQIEITLDAGLGLSIYGWAYFSAYGAPETAQQLLDRYGQYAPHTWWMDCEDTEYPYADWRRNADWLGKCLRVFDEGGYRNGVYTGNWWWTDPRFMNNTQMFADKPLWAATDDQEPDLLTRYLFGGWTRLTIEQYDLHGYDDNVIDNEFIKSLEATPVMEGQTVEERLSYLGGLTKDVLPQVVKELEAAHGKTQADQGHIDRALKAVKEHAG